MAKVKFHIASKTELILDEDAKKGDLLDLADEQNIDTALISDKLALMIQKEVALEKKTWDKNAAEKEAVLNAKFASELETEVTRRSSELEKQVAQLQTQLAEKEKQAERDEKQLRDNLAAEQKLSLTEQEAKFKSDQEKQQQQLNDLQAKVKALETEKEQALEMQKLTHQNELQTKEHELADKISAAENKLQFKEQESKLELQKMEQEYQVQLDAAQKEVEFYKDFKARQSTKEIGESLEQYAEQEFNKIRAMAFPNAYFEKDNEVSKASGSKGDFIFRDYTDDGLEFISIMFDMKNEADTTATKHRNRDFFKELDKDRQEKNTEYAVLVSMLEADSDLYNTGIVQVHDYEKMYVVRPQFFIQLIGLLRNAALNSVIYKEELNKIKNQNIDITNFEDEINTFKNSFSTTAKNFNGNLEKLDKNLDDAIRNLTNARDELRKAMKNLGTAENKLDNLTIKRLTRGNQTMQERFAEL